MPRTAKPMRSQKPSEPVARRPVNPGAPKALTIYVDKVPQHSPAEMAEVHQAVETLYDDQLKPYSRILRKRLAERAQLAGLGEVEIDGKSLRALCVASPWLDVLTENGDDWSTAFNIRTSNFVDVYSPADVYPSDLWSAAAHYFDSMNEDDQLPGGRYLCAQVLMNRGLSFLAGYSLGQVCHIVQLGISQKKLLGYTNGTIVPYDRSQSMVKERCAQSLRPCGDTAEGESGTAASWEQLHECVRHLLHELAPRGGSISLSSIKRLFGSRFQLKLSETTLGYAKLSELFQDPRLHDLCAVRLQGQGHVIVPVFEKPATSKQICLMDSLAIGSGPKPQHKPAAETLRERAWWVSQLKEEDMAEEDLATPLEPSGTRPPVSRSACSPSNDAAGFFPPTPSPRFMRSSQQLPRLLGFPGHGRSGACCNAGLPADAGSDESPTAATPPTLDGSDHSSRTPSHDSEGGSTLGGLGARGDSGRDDEPPAHSPSIPAGLLLTPGTMGNLGVVVKNTFLHAASAPQYGQAGLSQLPAFPRSVGGTPQAWFAPPLPYEHYGGRPALAR